MTIPPVRVAVVDSGIHASHPHVRGVAGGVGFDSEGRPHSDWVDRLGHGTAVAAAIRDLAPSVELLAVKVFDRSLQTSVTALTAAIEWSATNGATLINLSLGIADPTHQHALQIAVDQARSAGSVVVAAGRDDGVSWLPGVLDGVLRVEVDWRCTRGEFTAHRENRSSIFRTCGYPRSIPGVEPERNLKGLSFAVANMTGLAARLAADRGLHGLDPIVDALHEGAAGPAS